MKYRHTPETRIVLEDLINRVTQLMEVNKKYERTNPELVSNQNTAFSSVLTLLEQVKDNGHVMRGNEFFPDPVEAEATTKWDKKPQLGLKI